MRIEILFYKSISYLSSKAHQTLITIHHFLIYNNEHTKR